MPQVCEKCDESILIQYESRVYQNRFSTGVGRGDQQIQGLTKTQNR